MLNNKDFHLAIHMISDDDPILILEAESSKTPLISNEIGGLSAWSNDTKIEVANRNIFTAVPDSFQYLNSQNSPKTVLLNYKIKNVIILVFSKSILQRLQATSIHLLQKTQT